MEKPHDKTAQEFLEILEGVPPFVDYTYWENLKQRKIIFNSEVNTQVVEYIVMQILKFNEEDKDIPVEKRVPIKLYISSHGGSVIEGFNVIDVIKSSKTPVYTIALGLAASMSALILISGHKRFAYTNSTVLLHDGSLMLASTSKKAKQTMEYYDKLDNRIQKFILENTKISEELYKQKHDEEWYLFGSPDALELGIVDEII